MLVVKKNARGFLFKRDIEVRGGSGGGMMWIEVGEGVILLKGYDGLGDLSSWKVFGHIPLGSVSHEMALHQK